MARNYILGGREQPNSKQANPTSRESFAPTEPVILTTLLVQAMGLVN